MHLLDTDTLTHLYHGNSNVIEHLQNVADPDVGTTIITRIELLKGRFDFMLKAENDRQLLRAQELLSRTEELLSQLLIVPVDKAAADRFETLRAARGLRKIGRADILIASIVLAHNATLVTRNLRHFQQIPGLKVVNWVD
jgi:tRNA(fMet)-specific endonuclease VapC